MSSSSSYSSYSYSDEDSEDLSWISRFCNIPENYYMCVVDEEYIRDSFNLYGLDSECTLYNPAINLILDSDGSSSESCEDCDEQDLSDTAEYLYGMIHARFIISLDGLEQMLSKYKRKHFGVCSRVFCNEQPLLPVGLSDIPNVDNVKLFCPCCKEVYNPPDEFGKLDGAFFGTTFPHLFLLQYPEFINSPSQTYEPSIFGYKIHSTSPYYTQEHEQCKENDSS